VLRNAIEMYRARSGTYPANLQLPSAMTTMLNGQFPSPSFGAIRDNSDVYYDTDDDANTMAAPSPGAGGWVYKPKNGTLKLNLESPATGFDW
jgi:general secretion pathway protein G